MDKTPAENGIRITAVQIVDAADRFENKIHTARIEELGEKRKGRILRARGYRDAVPSSREYGNGGLRGCRDLRGFADE